MWILFSLLAACCYGFRFVAVKHFLPGVSPLWIAFFARLGGVLFLFPWLLFRDPVALSFPVEFWSVTALTVMLTAAASLIQFHAVQKYSLSGSVPFLSFVPLFMLVSVYVFYGETGTPAAAAGILMLFAGSYLIDLKPGERLTEPLRQVRRNRGGLLFLLVAAVYGITTALDRIPIRLADAFTYSFYWNCASLVLFSFVVFFRRRTGSSVEVKKHFAGFLLQGLLGAAGFTGQMFAVEAARKISYDVVYVKAVTMLQVLIAVVAGILFFHEKAGRRRFPAALLMTGGAAVIIIFYRV